MGVGCGELDGESGVALLAEPCEDGRWVREFGECYVVPWSGAVSEVEDFVV